MIQKKIIYIMIVFLYVVGFMICCVVFLTPECDNMPIKENKPLKRIKIDYIDSVKLCDTLQSVLKLREGYSENVYSDKKGFHYQGYGHKIVPISKDSAISILKNDIIACFKECRRLKAEINYHNLFNLFISGKI